MLKPGEIGYVSAYTILDDATSVEDAADYQLTVSGKSAKKNPNITLPAEVKYVCRDGGWREIHEMYAVVTNNTDATVYNYRVIVAVKTAEGKLVFVEDVMPSYVGIMPGTSVEVKIDLTYDSVVEELLEQGKIGFDQVEVIAYVDTDY